MYLTLHRIKCLLLVSLLTATARGEWIIPKSLGELGFLYSHAASVFGENASIPYLRAERARLRFEYGYDDAGLRRQILNNFATLTHSQWGWNDILMRVEKPPVGNRLVFAPMMAGRASVAGSHEMADVDDLHRQFSPGHRGGDQKGSGITGMTEGKLNYYRALFHTLSGEDEKVFLNVKADNVVEAMRQWVVEAKKDEGNINAALGKARTREDRVVISTHLSSLRKELAVTELYLQGLEEQRTQGHTHPNTLTNFIYALAELDYTNGLFEASRAVKEAIIAELLEEVYGVLNPVWGTELGVVPIDFVIILPVKMRSVSYREEQYAGILGRPLTARAFPDPENRRYWYPKELVYSVLPGAEQFDINGRFIDLENIALKVPGIETYFGAHPQGYTVIDQLSIKAVNDYLAGDQDAVTKVIAEIKSKIDKPKLTQWAKAHRPPRDAYFKSAFISAGDTLVTLDRDRKKADSGQVRKLKDQLTQIRLAGSSDQLTALWPLLFRVAPEVAQNFWKETLTQMAEHERNVRRLIQQKKEHKLRGLDIRHVGDLLSMLFFNPEVNDHRDAAKFQFAEDIATVSPALFEGVYGQFGAEFYRQKLAHLHMTDMAYQPDLPRYEAAEKLIGKLSLAVMARTSQRMGIKVFDKLEAVEVGGKKGSFVQLASAFTRQSPEEMFGIISIVENLTGKEFPIELVREVFPEHAGDLSLHLGFQRTMDSLSMGDRLRCLMGIAGMFGLTDHTPDEIDSVGHLFDYLDPDNRPNRPLIE